MIYNREFETLKKEDLEQLQVERLQATLNRVYRNVAFYKHSFDEKKINIENLKSIKDLKNLPFTTREDLKRSYPYDMFAVPLRDIVRIHAASGTTKRPVVVGYTKNDIINWTTVTSRILAAAEITDHDFVQIAFNYNLSTLGFGFHYGAERIGATVIPSSNEGIRKQIIVMKDYKTSALISTPGFALHLASMLEEMNIHPEELSLKTGVFGSEPLSCNIRAKIEESLHINSFDNYGLSEIIGPGVAFECQEKNGLHVNEDHFIVEVIDPESLQPLNPGEKGELVFTTLTKQGFPLIRYRTGDISSISEAKCSCGRTFVRIEQVSGRTDDMIVFEGINVFPSQIEEILLDIEGIEPHFQIILSRKDGADLMEIKVEISEKLPDFDMMDKLEYFKDAIRKRLDAGLGIKTKITLVEPKTISRISEDKRKKVIDNRVL